MNPNAHPNTPPHASPKDPRTAGFGFAPHAYDPLTEPHYFDGVPARRVVAFLIDFVIIGLPVLIATVFIFLFGIVTFGVGWLLFWLMTPAAVIWALAYYGLCFGGAASATIGMRAMDLQMRTWSGEPAYFLLGAVHAILYWISVSALSPLVILVALFNARRRLLHDMLLGTVVINSEPRAAALRAMHRAP